MAVITNFRKYIELEGPSDAELNEIEEGYDKLSSLDELLTLDEDAMINAVPILEPMDW